MRVLECDTAGVGWEGVAVLWVRDCVAEAVSLLVPLRVTLRLLEAEHVGVREGGDWVPLSVKDGLQLPVLCVWEGVRVQEGEREIASEALRVLLSEQEKGRVGDSVLEREREAVCELLWDAERVGRGVEVRDCVQESDVLRVRVARGVSVRERVRTGLALQEQVTLWLHVRSPVAVPEADAEENTLCVPLRDTLTVPLVE